MMLPMLLLFAAEVSSPALPRIAKQGQTLRIRTNADAVSARFAKKVIRLFPQKEGGRLGLMPIPATQKPGAYRLELLDPKGAALQSLTVRVRNARFRSQNLIISKSLSTLKPAPGEQEAVRTFRETVTDERMWTEPLRLPVDGCMTSPFGVRRLHNRRATGDYHAGLDQRGTDGSAITAVTAGTVRLARMFNLRGGTVGIDHGQGLETIYMHMSKIATVEGAVVKAGDVIGYVGSTGRSTAPHLHWTLYANGVPVNPLEWVSVRPCR
jgi:murein DD-endopeptidase MepM/ murein hydrolase activator NlpD